MQTLVVNLFGGPGVSKSTNMALVFGKLKTKGINAEMAPEYAKALVWEKRHVALSEQQYIIAKQIYWVTRLVGQVDVVVTDSPILFGLIYGKQPNKYWKQHVLSTFKSWNTCNFLLQRDPDKHLYVEKGRTQTEEEAVAVDKDIEVLLQAEGIHYWPVRVRESDKTADAIVELVEHALY